MKNIFTPCTQAVLPALFSGHVTPCLKVAEVDEWAHAGLRMNMLTKWFNFPLQITSNEQMFSYGNPPCYGYIYLFLCSLFNNIHSLITI
jgi:hypothetical protein